MQTQNRGFSLLELMIVIAIIGALAAMAFPSYTQYVLRTNRTVAKTALTRIASEQESYFSDRKKYAATLDALSSAYAGSTVYLKKDGTTVSSNTTSAIYSLTLTGTSDTTFTVEAAPVNYQTQDTKCLTLKYTNTGSKSVTGTATDCWTR